MTESNDMPTRQCAHCKEIFPLTAEYFHRSKSNTGGLTYLCKPCNRRRYVAYGASKAKRYAEEGHTVASLKRCSACKEEKPATLDYFGSNKYQKDGLRSQCKACINPKQREKYPDSLPYRLAYKEANKDKIDEQNKEYREKNRKRIHERNKETYKKLSETGKLDRAKRNKMTKDWRARNPDHSREYTQRTRKESLIRTQLRNARKASHPNDYTPADWQFALDYFKGCCAVCGRPAGFFHKIAMDHWIPLSRSDCLGTVPHNIVPLCHGIEGCNNSKNYRDPEKWLIAKFGKVKGSAILLRVAEFFTHVRQL